MTVITGKTMKKWIYAALMAFTLTACSSEESATGPVEKIVIVDQQQPESDSKAVELKIELNTVNVRSEPKMGSSVISKLPSGATVLWQDQVSNVTAPVKLRGVRYNDPWLYIKRPDGESGWIYAATVSVLGNHPAAYQLRQKLIARRVDGFFGAELATAMSGYGQAFIQIKSSENFANVYNYGIKLRDQLDEVLHKRAQADVDPPADMRWLDYLVPAYKHARVAEGSRYQLFADYKQLAAKAAGTEDNIDDEFVALLQMVYGGNREGVFPAWITPTWDYGGDNLLGKGIYKKIFDQAETVQQSGALFADSVLAIKQRMLSALSGKDVKFANSSAQRQQEVMQILQAGYSFLTDEDKASLQHAAAK